MHLITKIGYSFIVAYGIVYIQHNGLEFRSIIMGAVTLLFYSRLARSE